MYWVYEDALFSYSLAYKKASVYVKYKSQKIIQ